MNIISKLFLNSHYLSVGEDGVYQTENVNVKPNSLARTVPPISARCCAVATVTMGAEGNIPQPTHPSAVQTIFPRCHCEEGWKGEECNVRLDECEVSTAPPVLPLSEFP